MNQLDVRLAKREDYLRILDLESRNYIDNVPETERRDGFLSARMTEDQVDRDTQKKPTSSSPSYATAMPTSCAILLFIHERKRTRRSRVPRVRGNHIKRSSQPGFRRISIT